MINTMKNSFISFIVIIFFTLFFGKGNVHAYSDVGQDSPFLDAITFTTDKGLTKGYRDGSFRPHHLITRAEFIKLMVFSSVPENFTLEGTPCFNDVSKSDWFFTYVCYAKKEKIVKGYEDGSFKPEQYITFAEAAKIVSEMYGSKDPLPGKYWYSSYLSDLSNSHAIPETVHYINQEVTRGEVVEMIWRLMEKITDRSSPKAPEIEENRCQKTVQENFDTIDMGTVTTTWLQWYNDARKEQGLPSYKYNVQLNRTAAEWSEYSKARGFIDHKRPGQTAYYDYGMIKEWFKKKGLEFRAVHGATFTENIGWDYYACSSDDCTENLTKAIRHTFDFFMNEKGKSYKPHYESIMNREFREIGVGISLDPGKKRYYLTVHYGTEIVSNPDAICPVREN